MLGTAFTVCPYCKTSLTYVYHVVGLLATFSRISFSTLLIKMLVYNRAVLALFTFSFIHLAVETKAMGNRGRMERSQKCNLSFKFVYAKSPLVRIEHLLGSHKITTSEL